jgi:hypothetical protein
VNGSNARRLKAAGSAAGRNRMPPCGLAPWKVVAMRSLSPLMALACLFAVELVSPRPASAIWPALGREIATPIGNQLLPKATTDGAAGAIVVWQDVRDKRPVNIFARRVLASGELDPRWPIDGTSLLANPAEIETTAFLGQRRPVITSDGAGGAIVAWEDGRLEFNGQDIFAQHVLGSGVVDPTWPANGIAVCTVRSDQLNPTIVSDGAGGAIVTWIDSRNGRDSDVFAQHVLASGVLDPRWPVVGLALSTAPANQVQPSIAADGSGGAIVTWSDFRPSASGIDVYAQHALNAGVVDPAWPVNGRALSLAPGTQFDPAIASDNAHGAIVTWADERDGRSHIFAQRVTGSGAIAQGWPVNGLAVCVSTDDEVHPLLTSDGASGAIITWRDARSGLNHNPFAQHVLGAGLVDPGWPVNGRRLTSSGGEQVAAAIVGDGAAGAIISWEEDSFVFVNHILGSGVLDPTFPVNGQFVRLLLTFQHDPDLVASGRSDAIVVWADGTSSENFDIYGQLAATSITLDVDPMTPPAGIALAPVTPNPASGVVTLRFTLPHAASVSLAIFDPAGRRVREVASGVATAGEHAFTWDLRDESGKATAAGVFLARLETEGRVVTRKLVKLK